MEEKKGEGRLVLSTKKSLYDPVEIVIDDKVYHSLKVTRAVAKEIDKLDAEIGKDKKDDEALYKAVQLLYDIDLKVLEELDKREVEQIYIFSKQKFVEIEKERMKLVLASFGSTWATKEKVKKVIPKNPKRSGAKR